MPRLASIGARSVHQPLTLSIYNQLEASTDWDYVAGADIGSVTGGNTITITSRYHKVTISAGTIDTITDAAGAAAGQLVSLHCVNANTIRNNGGGTGNIRTISGADVSVSAGQVATLVYDGALWREQIPVDAAILNPSGGLTLPSLASSHGSAAVGGDGTHSGYSLSDTALAGLLASVAVNPTNVILSSTVAGDATDYRFTVTAAGTIQWGTGAARDTSLSRAAAGLLAIGGSSTAVGNYEGGYANSAPGLPAMFTPNLASLMNRVAPINASGTLTIAAPSNPPASTGAGFFFMILENASGGALTLSWNAAYGTVPGTPGNGTGIMILWVWNASQSKWYPLIVTSFTNPF